jgi:hypothetical protein
MDGVRCFGLEDEYVMRGRECFKPVSTKLDLWTEKKCEHRVQQGSDTKKKHTFSLSSISKHCLSCVIRHGFGKSLPRDHEDLSTIYLECKTMSMA